MLTRMVSISWPCDPPASASQSAGITGLSHRPRPEDSTIKEEERPWWIIISGRMLSTMKNSQRAMIDVQRRHKEQFCGLQRGGGEMPPERGWDYPNGSGWILTSGDGKKRHWKDKSWNEKSAKVGDSRDKFKGWILPYAQVDDSERCSYWRVCVHFSPNIR